MARLAYCLVLISLCLSLPLEPSLAHEKENESLEPTSDEYLAPAPAPFASAPAPFASFVTTQQQTLVTKLCQDTKKPRLCTRIVQGHKDTLMGMKPMTLARSSIDLATSVATRACAYMTAQITKNHIKVEAKEIVEGCKSNYQSAVVDLNLAYNTYKHDHVKAIEILKEVDIKVEFCATSLKSGGALTDIVPIVQTNKVIKGLVQVAHSIAIQSAH